MKRISDLAGAIGAEAQAGMPDVLGSPEQAGMPDVSGSPAPSDDGPCGGGERYSLCVIGAGDVGINTALGLRLLGSGVIDRMGIYDPDPKRSKRAEMEVGQVAFPNKILPPIERVSDMDCVFTYDVILFTASRGVPDLGSGVKDVRLAQLEANAEMIRSYAEEVRARKYGGFFFIMSDPVDDLCNVMLKASGMSPDRIRGFGLGVMNARARYYAERDGRFLSYLKKGRAFGQHGEGLVLADSIEDYDDEVSRELTRLVRNANLEVRELGFKPYIAPAFSSGAVSVLETLRCRWNHGSVYIGDADKGSYFGVLSRLTPEGFVWEDRVLPGALFARLEESFRSLYERDKDL